MADTTRGKANVMADLLRNLAVPAVAVTVLAGCASGRAGAARDAAETFERAWETRDGARVCALLASAVREEVESTTDEPCAAGVLSEDLPPAAATRHAEVWGDAAQVRTGTDVVFLSHYDRGWQVTAAGCSPRAGRPYDCILQAG